MALHSKKEFAELCGMPSKSLSVYISRGHVLVGENDQIDDKNPVNAAFREKHGARAGRKQPKASGDKSSSGTPKRDEGFIQTMRDKTEAELENKRVNNDLKRLELKKKMGQVVPTEDVKRLFVMHSENIKGAYVEASDNLIVIFGNKGGLNATDISEMRKKFVDLVNGAIDKAIAGTKGRLQALVAEFSEKRGVGQHD